MENSCKTLLERCAQLYSFDSGAVHGFVHVSRFFYNLEDDLFFNKDVVFIEVYGDNNAYGKYANSYLSGTISVADFKMQFENECRLPIFYKL